MLWYWDKPEKADEARIGLWLYAVWQAGVREVRHPWQRRNMRYGCRWKIGSNWSG